jgi:hypothetical protein
MTIRRTLVALAAAAGLVLVGASPAMAGGSPHFIKNATSASIDGVSLVVDFKEAGLESGAIETIQVTADLEALFQCVNNGGHVPSDPKKTVFDDSVSAFVDLPVGQNGNLVGTISLDPPAAGDVLDCPGGQTSTLVSVIWSNVRLDDLTSGASISLRGVFTGP